MDIDYLIDSKSDVLHIIEYIAKPLTAVFKGTCIWEYTTAPCGPY